MKNSSVLSAGAGAMFRMEIPCLKRRSAANVAGTGVSNWQSSTWNKLIKALLIWIALDKCAAYLRRIQKIIGPFNIGR